MVFPFDRLRCFPLRRIRVEIISVGWYRYHEKNKFIRCGIWDTKSFEVAMIGLVPGGGGFEGQFEVAFGHKVFRLSESSRISHNRLQRVARSLRIDKAVQSTASTSTGSMADWSVCRASHRVPGHWASPAHRGQPHAQALPHAHLCAQPCRGQVSVLVLLDSAQEGQEGQR